MCYYCDEKFQPSHRCNRPRLYLLEGLEVEGLKELEEVEAPPPKAPATEVDREEGKLMGISLYTIGGAPSPKTIRLAGTINHQIIVILIDSGSTHSFVDPNVARKVRLPVHEKSKIVQVANGDTLPCRGCCKAVSSCLQGHSFTTTLYLLSQGAVT